MESNLGKRCTLYSLSIVNFYKSLAGCGGLGGNSDDGFQLRLRKKNYNAVGCS